LAGGQFTSLGGQACNGLGRLNNTYPAWHQLAVDGSTITWRRVDSSPELACVAFEASTNQADYVSLGTPSRISGGWQLEGASLPVGAIVVRARGWVLGGQGNGSSWLLEDTWAAQPLTIILNDGCFGFSAGDFGFNISGNPSQTTVIETSCDLQNWTSLSTNAPSAAPVHFSDPGSSTLPLRFYRARSQ
jgi:hypothetical protein